MRSLHVKSIVLGIGLGIIITSVISIIYLAGVEPSKMPDKEEIIKLAEGYGMIMGPEFDMSKLNDDTSAVNNSPQAESEARVSINNGDTPEIVAGKLIKASIIKDQAAFLNELENMKLTNRINPGEYLIETGMNIKKVIEIITRTQ